MIHRKNINLREQTVKYENDAVKQAFQAPTHGINELVTRTYKKYVFSTSTFYISFKHLFLNKSFCPYFLKQICFVCFFFKSMSFILSQIYEYWGLGILIIAKVVSCFCKRLWNNKNFATTQQRAIFNDNVLLAALGRGL